MKTKCSPEKAVVWIERASSGVFLCIARSNNRIERFDLSKAGSLMIGARYRVVVGAPKDGNPTRIVGDEPEYSE